MKERFERQRKGEGGEEGGNEGEGVKEDEPGV